MPPRDNEYEKNSGLTLRIEVERFSVVSSRPFEEVIAAVNAGIAHPDLAELLTSVQQSNSVARMESIIHQAIGEADLMRFTQI